MNLLNKAPTWATHLVEHIEYGGYWWVNCKDYRWSRYNTEEIFHLRPQCEKDVTSFLSGLPHLYRVTEINIQLDNE